MPAQLAQDLKTLVCRRVGQGRRVALLSADDALAKALEANQNSVIVDPDEDQLTAFDAQIVVGFDALCAPGADGLSLVKRAAPQASLVLSFSNAASASRLIRELTGTPVPPGVAEREFTERLTSAGYVVKHRDLVVTSATRPTLAVQTEVALRQLFEQLNPDAAADRLLLVAERGTQASRPDLEETQVSVIIATAGALPGALEGTLQSLGRQTWRPLELVIVSDAVSELEATLSVLKARTGVFAHAVHSGGTLADQRNAGLQVAQGRRVTWVTPGTLFEPQHLKTLVNSIESEAGAWAIAAAPTGLRELSVNPSAWLFDRERLGSFALTWVDDADAAAVLATRLWALFRPAFTGQRTVDAPSAQPMTLEAVLAHFAGRPLQALTTLSELTRAPARESLAAQLTERLTETAPAVAPLVDGASRVLKRVTGALREARASADAELKKERTDVD